MIESRMMNPMDSVFNFIKYLDNGIRGQDFMNYNVRGDLVTIYMQPDQMVEYAHLLFTNGYEDMENPYWEYHGYNKNGYYYRIGPYRVRLAQYREKIQHEQDIKWLQEQHQDEVSKLKLQILKANNTIMEIQKLIQQK